MDDIVLGTIIEWISQLDDWNGTVTLSIDIRKEMLDDERLVLKKGQIFGIWNIHERDQIRSKYSKLIKDPKSGNGRHKNWW